jgi:uncharacterized protein YcnI
VRRALGLAFALVLVTATPAFAHVAVSPSEVHEGEAAELTFRVPNESDAADTTSVEIAMPADRTFDFVSAKAVPGWTVDTEKTGDAVTSITWSGGEIAPGQFDEFSIVVGPVEGTGPLAFRAVQTYDDGDVVRWIDPMVEGGEEPEHPAPTATVVAGSGEDGHGGEAAESTEDEDSDGVDPLAFVALVVAGAAAVAAVAALIFARKRPPV